MDWLLAHGLGAGRSDLPIPEWLFGWAAAVVLIVSFLALAVLWPKPRLEDDRWKRRFRVPAPRVVDAVCGAIGVALLALVVYSGFAGEQTPSGNFASLWVFVAFWLGLAAASVLVGDIFRAFNPWRAVGRAVAGVAKRFRGGELPEPLPYPEKLGHWPAAIGIAAFAWMEYIVTDGTQPEKVAVAALIYSALTFVGMALYGVDRWIERGEAFSVYFNLYSRISIWERRGDEIGTRPALSGLAALRPMAGTVPLLAVMIGTVTFDGAAEGSAWLDISPDIVGFFRDDIGLSPDNAFVAALSVGQIATILLLYGFYRLGIAGAKTAGGGFDTPRLAKAFVHSLVPIAFVYTAAHYMTELLFSGQRVWPALSDPLGNDYEDWGIDLTIIGANATWYWQVGFVVLGHVAALMLAHDRAIALYERAKDAVRSQYWMLAVMVGFTSLALWLLSQANE